MEYTYVIEKVSVVLAVDNGNPSLGVDHEVLVDENVAGKRYSVPGSRLDAVAAVAFMLYDESEFAYISVFDEERFSESYAGIEIQVGHRHGVLKDIPEAFLGIEEIEICAPGQCGFCQSLCD